MQRFLLEVTGDEPKTEDGGPLDALIEFYRAFNSRDLAAVQAVWAVSHEPSMGNPIGGIRRGWRAIAEGYSRIFEGRTKVQVTFHDFSSQGGDDWHLFVGRERGVCQTPERSMALAIRTTRWFVRKDGAWLQLHHHGSVEDPKMLAEYQKLIFGDAGR